MNQVTAIIPTYNNIKGLKYVVGFLQKRKIPTIVVDNKPDDEKLHFAKATRGKADVVYLPQEENLGFARAVNKASKHVKTQWMLILNDDIKFHNPETIEKLYKFVIDNDLMAATPIFVRADGHIENCGYQVLPYGRIKLFKNPPTRQLANQPTIDGLTAACLLINTELFHDTHGFDNSFFAYLEDVDFFLRLKRVGIKFGVCPDLTITHYHMTTSHTMKSFKQWQDLKNWIRLIIKFPDFFPRNPRNLIAIFVERGRNLSGYLKSKFDILRVSLVRDPSIPLSGTRDDN
ncbi:hypothetical protein A3J15_03215 [Candidatus Roizmanbacteria bacterium RIFCSPLOWO2_02_FULL_38_10]|uniref:Glycosyltransferase 2-like domain-containing protein n=1 Tax=Candidatus Roizmanbacteria bacterium RIFCSPLOWO2_02_FULL_38_10 TaxID=1802074 RepID=A0A1F7JL49_9BACT|nr:MAG: hypothetical protein A3J15_03215 [Candidatus Roizmanbacteria bacterium RIFCSPLOWO2_02_FULL_38_10]